MAADRLFCDLLGCPGNIWIVVPAAVPVEAGFDYYSVHTRLCETLNVGRIGSPIRPALRTFVWVTFELPKPVYHRSPSNSARKRRRNPIVLAQDWQQLLTSGKFASKAELARQLGVSRAHVTQVLGLLQLAPDLQDVVAALGDPINGKGCGVHTLRSLLRPNTRAADTLEQEITRLSAKMCWFESP